jgi:2-amino-4-hydroxy-6-hydroxymethyldihydropteridine diphosphokinase
MLIQNIFLLTGSNLGDRLSNLVKCAELIEQQAGHIVKRSSVYETAPWGKTDQDHFLNQALELESALQPQELLTACLAIEKKIGRVRDEKWGSRTIDIDIIYFNDQVIDSDDLKIPHPRIAERRFVLVPICELAPEFMHPILKKTNALLLKECTDALDVAIFHGVVW